MPWSVSEKHKKFAESLPKEPFQLMEVYTKGQLLAVIEAFREDIETVILVHKKDGSIFKIHHRWTGMVKCYVGGGKWHTEKAKYTLDSVKKSIRSRIRKIPAKVLLGG